MFWELEQHAVCAGGRNRGERTRQHSATGSCASTCSPTRERHAAIRCDHSGGRGGRSHTDREDVVRRHSTWFGSSPAVSSGDGLAKSDERKRATDWMPFAVDGRWHAGRCRSHQRRGAGSRGDCRGGTGRSNRGREPGGRALLRARVSIYGSPSSHRRGASGTVHRGTILCGESDRGDAHATATATTARRSRSCGRGRERGAELKPDTHENRRPRRFFANARATWAGPLTGIC